MQSSESTRQDSTFVIPSREAEALIIPCGQERFESKYLIMVEVRAAAWPALNAMQHLVWCSAVIIYIF